MTVAEPTMEEEVIPITQQMLKPPPPPPPAPKLTDLIDIVEDDTDIEEQLEIEDVEADVENREVQNYDYDGEYDPDDNGRRRCLCNRGRHAGFSGRRYHKMD